MKGTHRLIKRYLVERVSATVPDSVVIEELKGLGWKVGRPRVHIKGIWFNAKKRINRQLLEISKEDGERLKNITYVDRRRGEELLIHNKEALINGWCTFGRFMGKNMTLKCAKCWHLRDVLIRGGCDFRCLRTTCSSK